MVTAKNFQEALHYLHAVGSQLARDGITSYCQQVCGGGECGTGPMCMQGIDHETQMPTILIPSVVITSLDADQRRSLNS